MRVKNAGSYMALTKLSFIPSNAVDRLTHTKNT
uniref:Uncharacterized protein n=1 Tax=Anguilla anguilla TaxID=7936 RepID=A0A0E9VQM6_ANGAN